MRAMIRNRIASCLWIVPVSILALGPAPARSIGGCLVIDESELISVEIAPGKSAYLELYESTGNAGEKTCWASIEVPLSSFPTSRLALRPADVARSMHDVMKKLGEKECAVRVMYHNDTNEPLASHELCLEERFEFGERKHWSSSPERFCWDPVSSEAEIITVD